MLDGEERYIKIEASGDQYCSIKVTGNSEITVNFVILNYLFDIYRER